MEILIFTLLGYMSGSILYAYWIPKLCCHIDICELSPDHNPGTANAFTYGGFYAGTAALLLELGKGFLPVFMAGRFVPVNSLGFVPILVAPVLGHAFPLMNRKKGGKAIATSFGVLLGLYPLAAPVLFLAASYLVFSLVVVIDPHLFRSIITFGATALLNFLFTPIVTVSIAFLLIAGIVIYKHAQAFQGEKLTLRLQPISRWHSTRK